MLIVQTSTLDPEARAMFKRGLDEELTLGEVLEQVEEHQGTLYLLHHDDKLVGVAYFQVFGGVLNLRSLSGENIRDWALEFQAFIICLMKQHNIPHFRIFSRKGWHRLFPALKFEGAVYSFDLGGPLQDD